MLTFMMRVVITGLGIFAVLAKLSKLNVGAVVSTCAVDKRAYTKETDPAVVECARDGMLGYDLV